MKIQIEHCDATSSGCKTIANVLRRRQHFEWRRHLKCRAALVILFHNNIFKWVSQGRVKMSPQTVVIMRFTAGHCRVTGIAFSASIWQVQTAFIDTFHSFRILR